MRTLTYYIAVTLDGFIAGPSGEFDFFTFEGDFAAAVVAELPETLPTPARAALGVGDAPNRRFDTVVMGRGTYEPGLAVGLTSPYAHLRQFVVSGSLAEAGGPGDPDVTIVGSDPVALVRGLKAEPGLGIWLAGGGQLAGQLLDEIDELVLKRNPIAIGAGLPLFAGPFVPTGFELHSARPFEAGVVIESYRRSRDA